MHTHSGLSRWARSLARCSSHRRSGALWSASEDGFGLLAEDGTHLRVFLEVLHHLIEMSPSALIGGLHVNELFDDLVAVFLCIGRKQFPLRGDRIALPLLLLGGYSDVEDCFFRGGCFCFKADKSLWANTFNGYLVISSHSFLPASVPEEGFLVLGHGSKARLS